MAQTLVNIRMDENLKRAFDATCSDLGLNMSTAITIFAKKMTKTGLYSICQMTL